MPAPDQKRSDSGFTQLAAGFAVLISLAALLGVAFKADDNGASGQVATTATEVTAPSAATENVKLVVKSDAEHGKKGSDGNWHDAFLPADFSVKAGATVHVTVYNYDDMSHSFTASELDLNVTVPAGSEEKPSETTFTFHAPQKAGSYEWYCALPCDPWAMTQSGFMKGRVRVI